MTTATREVELLGKVAGYLPSDKVARVAEAFQLADRCHAGQLRRSGEPYVEHPLKVAGLLADLQLDSNTIVGALLHDVLEDSDITRADLEKRFGSDVVKLVDGVTKLSQIEDQTVLALESGAIARPSANYRLQAESLRKMLVAMAEDVRVILIKLADRLHNMQTIKSMPAEARLRIARETLDVYAPLAHRLGIANFKWQLEDLAFRNLNPDKYAEVSKLVARTRSQREDFVSQVSALLQQDLKDAGVKAEISGRPKHIYSIYQKMERYAAQGRDFDQIYDLFAFRVLVDDIATCYGVLGLVHKRWHPIPGEFDDYIANPRENMYQSLHTAVVGPNTLPFEVQIRTHRMHEVAEYGIAAHFRYKEGGHGDHSFDDRMTWLRQLLEWQKEQPAAEDFMESVKTDIFPDQVFVYTPKGEVRELPVGSTPIDFAYRIHTDLGHRCAGAKVNGKMVTLDRPLKNGDTVEIIVSKAEKGPSLDWLNPDLGYLKTANALAKVRAWFRKRTRHETLASGRTLLEKELRRLHLTTAEKEIATALGYESVEDLLVALGSGALSTHQLAPKLLPVAETPPLVLPSSTAPEKVTAGDAVMVLNQSNMLTRLGKCCHPLAGDPIVGYVTRTNGVTVHRENCRNIQHASQVERRIPVSWGAQQTGYSARIAIEAWDRVGLLRDITTLISGEKVNISAARTTIHKKGTMTEVLTIDTHGADHLSRILSKLETIKGVTKVSRMA